MALNPTPPQYSWYQKIASSERVEEIYFSLIHTVPLPWLKHCARPSPSIFLRFAVLLRGGGGGGAAKLIISGNQDSEKKMSDERPLFQLTRTHNLLSFFLSFFLSFSKKNTKET